MREMVTNEFEQTELDVQNETSKGFYHDTDMNRVGEVNTIVKSLRIYGDRADRLQMISPKKILQPIKIISG